eukprot:1149665-Pelagomonas_calceolata.AAC.8
MITKVALHIILNGVACTIYGGKASNFLSTWHLKENKPRHLPARGFGRGLGAQRWRTGKGEPGLQKHG